MEGIDLERLAYEKAHAVQFDWAMFVRPDVTFVDPLPPRLAGSAHPVKRPHPQCIVCFGH